VADKALPILMSKSELGIKKLQKILQEKFNVVIGYDTLWKGKEKTMTELYDTWEKKILTIVEVESSDAGGFTR
jgi:hypothetical protein